MKKKRFTKKRIKSLLHKVIPFILVGVITSSAVMMSYERAREVKAVAGVDDIALMVALLAMCGIAYVATNDTTDEELSERFADEWDNGTKDEGVLLGYIDPETGEYIGILEGSGGNTGGDDGDPDNDDKDPDKNNFPTWANLKETVAKCGGRVDLALGATAATYLVGALGHSILKSAEEGAKKPYGLPEDVEKQLQILDSKLEDYCMEKKVNLLDYPYECTYIKYFLPKGTVWIYRYHFNNPIVVYKYISDEKESYAHIQPDDSTRHIETIALFKPGSYADYPITIRNGSTAGSNYYNFNSNEQDYYYFNVPIFSNRDDALAYINSENPQTVYPDKYVNPSTIGQTSALKDMLKETDGKLEKGLHNAAILPTTEQLNKYFEDLKNALNEEEKQEVMDEFVRSLTDPVTDPNPDPNPNPNPNPDPDPNPNPNPDPDPNPDNPGDNTGDDTPKNESFLADLKHLFPFCIPFDLVDCFRLFNAEPVTPRVEVPVHFGIINYDHTFVFDLSDFNGVASVCRFMFLILYMVGLILATRALIKG